MKVSKSLLLVLFLILINVSSVIGQQQPEPPQPTTNSVSAAAAGPIAPPGVPIDQHLIVLLAVALIFGIFTIYTYNSKRKASV
jgi:hypothetical protein